MKILPAHRPKLTRTEALNLLAPLAIDFAKYPIVAFGVRGYFKHSMGDPTKNDRSLYDDAFGLLTDREYSVFNGNTDPTAPEGVITGRACLSAGFWPMWRLDMHRGQYLAFCQRLGECVVHRDNTEAHKKNTAHPSFGYCLGNGLWRGSFGINGHRGGYTTTGSEGCQTVPEPQWSELITLAESEAHRLWKADWNKRCIPYALIEAA